MSTPVTVGGTIHFGRTGRGARKVIREGPAPNSVPGRIPRVARLMALAIRIEGLVRTGQVRDYAEVARLGHVTRARVSQIVSLVNLAPVIQEAILDLPRIEAGDEPLALRDLLPIAMEPDWSRQIRAWKSLRKAPD